MHMYTMHIYIYIYMQIHVYTYICICICLLYALMLYRLSSKIALSGMLFFFRFLRWRRARLLLASSWIQLAESDWSPSDALDRGGGSLSSASEVGFDSADIIVFIIIIVIAVLMHITVTIIIVVVVVVVVLSIPFC